MTTAHHPTTATRGNPRPDTVLTDHRRRRRLRRGRGGRAASAAARGPDSRAGVARRVHGRRAHHQRHRCRRSRVFQRRRPAGERDGERCGCRQGARASRPPADRRQRKGVGRADRGRRRRPRDAAGGRIARNRAPSRDRPRLDGDRGDPQGESIGARRPCRRRPLPDEDRRRRRRVARVGCSLRRRARARRAVRGQAVARDRLRRRPASTRTRRAPSSATTTTTCRTSPRRHWSPLRPTPTSSLSVAAASTASRRWARSPSGSRTTRAAPC